MFCSNCGARASGNFCASCGAKLQKPDQIPAPAAHASAERAFEDVALDWSRMMQYDLLLQIPAVRRRIDEASRRSRLRISGEQFLATFDALVPTGVSMQKLAAVAQPLYAAMGLRTGTSDARKFDKPIGCVLVATLCGLARESCGIQSVRQGDEGCVLQAEIPSSLYAFAGELVLTVRAAGDSTWVEGAARIPGQVYDWGRSRRLLAALYKAIEEEAHRPLLVTAGDSTPLPPRRLGA